MAPPWRIGTGWRWRASARLRTRRTRRHWPRLSSSISTPWRRRCGSIRRPASVRHFRLSCCSLPLAGRSRSWHGVTMAATSTAPRKSSTATASTTARRPASALWCRRSPPALCAANGCICAPTCEPTCSREDSPASACASTAPAARPCSSTPWRTGRSATPPGRPMRWKGTCRTTPNGSSSSW